MIVEFISILKECDNMEFSNMFENTRTRVVLPFLYTCFAEGCKMCKYVSIWWSISEFAVCSKHFGGTHTRVGLCGYGIFKSVSRFGSVIANNRGFGFGYGYD